MNVMHDNARLLIAIFGTGITTAHCSRPVDMIFTEDLTDNPIPGFTVQVICPVCKKVLHETWISHPDMRKALDDTR